MGCDLVTISCCSWLGGGDYDIQHFVVLFLCLSLLFTCNGLADCLAFCLFLFAYRLFNCYFPFPIVFRIERVIQLCRFLIYVLSSTFRTYQHKANECCLMFHQKTVFNNRTDAECKYSTISLRATGLFSLYINM